MLLKNLELSRLACLVAAIATGAIFPFAQEIPVYLQSSTRGVDTQARTFVSFPSRVSSRLLCGSESHPHMVSPAACFRSLIKASSRIDCTDT